MSSATSGFWSFTHLKWLLWWLLGCRCLTRYNVINQDLMNSALYLFYWIIMSSLIETWTHSTVKICYKFTLFYQKSIVLNFNVDLSWIISGIQIIWSENLEWRLTNIYNQIQEGDYLPNSEAQQWYCCSVLITIGSSELRRQTQWPAQIIKWNIPVWRTKYKLWENRDFHEDVKEVWKSI